MGRAASRGASEQRERGGAREKGRRERKREETMASAMASDEGASRFDGVPDQYDPNDFSKHHDFRRMEARGAENGWRMQTRKRKKEELEQREADRPALETVATSATKRIKTSSTIGKKSGRSWKLEATSRSTSQTKSGAKKTWDEKMQKKRELDAWRKERARIRDEVKEANKAERKRREEKKKLKEENQKKTGFVFQQISNPRKLKNMSKKQFKNVILTTADLPSNNKKKTRPGSKK